MIKMSRKSIIVTIGTMIVSVALPFIVPFNNYWMCILVSFCYFTILSSSLNLLQGYTGQVSLGHNAFMAVGAYTYGIFAKKFTFFGSQVIGVFLGLLIAFLFGLLIGIACSRLSSIFLSMATSSFVKALTAIIVVEAWLTGGANGLTGVPRIKLFGIDKLAPAAYNRYLYYIALVMAFVIVMACWRLVNSKTGRAFRAIRNSPIAAASMGINVTGYKFLVCGISAAMAGLAGVIFAWNLSYLSADMFSKMGVRMLTMTVAGGMGTIPGPIIGSVIMGYLPELLRDFGGHLDGIYGLTIIIIFLFMPTGLFGGFEIIRNKITRVFNKSKRDELKETS